MWPILYGWGPTHWSTINLSGLTPMKKTHSLFLSSQQLLIAPQLGVAICHLFPIHVAMLTGLILSRFCSGCCSCCEFLRAMVCHVWKTLFCSSPLQHWLSQASRPTLGMFPEPCSVCVCVCPIYNWPFWRHIFSDSCESALTIIHCKRKLLWWG